MMEVDRIGDYLQRLTPQARSNLLAELERLEVSGTEIPGAAAIQEQLRAEFRNDVSSQNRANNPSRYFFAPLQPLLVDSTPEHANSGRVSRGSLTPIWEWISHDLLPTMARDYVKSIGELIAADNRREARQVVATFQTKVAKSLESTLGSPDGAAQTRTRLATYTASRAAYGDLVKIQCVLRARDTLAEFNAALPDKIAKFDDTRVARITALLDGIGKKDADVIPFAVALVAKRLKTPWQLIRLATKAAPGKDAADVAATPYAIAISMVLDRLEDKQLALRFALKNNRVMVAREILAEVYDTEYALQVRLDGLERSDWGARLASLMNAIAVLVEAEVALFPEEVGHVLGSRSLRSHQSLMGRLTYLAHKGRDAVSDGAAHLKRLIGQP